MKKLVVIASALLVAAPQLVQAEAYIGGKLGQSWLDDSCAVGSPCSDDSMGGGVYGGYNFTDMFGVELGYDIIGDFKSNFGDTGANVVDDKLKALTLAPKLNIPVGDFDLYGKLGGAWVDYDDKDDVALLAALGAEYKLTDSLAARLEYQRINNITDSFIDSLDANSVFLGLTYAFGAADDEPLPNEPEPQEELTPKAPEEPVAAPEPVPTKLFQEYGVELFDTDSFDLAPNSEQYFDWLVGVMKKYPQAHAEIVGHTDSRGSAEYNKALSENRAQSVADYLYSQGIEESRITVRGEGEESPKATNDTAEGRMENRRVEVIIDEFEIKE